MKILYLFPNAGIKAGSVQTKVLGQIAALNQGIDSCKGAFFSKEVTSITSYNEFVDLVPFDKAKDGYFKPIKQYELLMHAIYKYLAENEKEYDILYMRYPGAGKGLLKIAKEFGKKICIEHNSKETEEIIGHRNEHLPIKSFGKLLSWYHYVHYPLAAEKKYAPLIFKNIRLATCVSPEMAEYETKRAKSNNYKCVPIGNGIDVNRIPLRHAPAFDGQNLNLLFLKGTSGIAPWNGLDRIIKSMENYSGPINVNLNIAGKFIENEIEIPEQLKSKVHFTGYLSGVSLDNLFNTCHIAIGTLAFFRSNQNQNATLKVREYFARGIPFVYAYNDFDLENYPEGDQYCLKLPNDYSGIEMSEIISFCDEIYKNLQHPNQMREYAIKHFDYKVKMANLAGILKQNFKINTF